MTLKGSHILLITNYYVALLLLAIIAVIAFLLKIAYQYGLKKAIIHQTPNIKINDGLPNTPQQLNALINSLNDIIYEFNEDKLCLDVWFNELTERVVDPRSCVGKYLADVLGYERALKFNTALDFVIANHKSTSIEYVSDYGTGRWLIAKFTPVFDREGNYTARISASVTDISEQKQYANALKENTALLIEAQAIAKIGNWWYDDEIKESYWSESLFSILEIEKLPEGANEFDYYLSLVHPDDRENYRQFLLTLHTATQKQYEHRLVTPNGNLKYIKVIKGDFIYGDDGGLKRIFGIIQDITESKLSERAIKKGRAELIEAQRIAKIGNWNWDITSYKLSWSAEIASIFEIEPDLIAPLGIRRLLLKYVHKNDKFILQHLFKSAANIVNYTCVFRIVTASGAIKYISVIVGALLKNEDGSLRKIIGTLQDVTERKQVEIDYKRTENKYKLVLETIKLAAVSLNSEGKVTFCNQYLANLLGYSQKEIIGMDWFVNFIPDEVKQKVRGLFTTNALPSQYINPVKGRNGKQRTISWQNTVIYDENGLIKETTSIGEDITDQQKATQELIFAKELAEKSSRFKSDFLSIMSHEIRTPMNAVIGTTNLLLSEEPKPEQMEYLNILKFSGENLLAIINDILDYNKIEAGKLELNQLKFNIHHLAQKIKQSFYSKAAEKKINIELAIDEAIPEYVIGDQMRLSQILNNLVGNAVKFTYKGEIMIKLQAEHADSGRASIKFLVSDTGIGIAPESHHVIFDPFMQVPLINNNNNGGTGLGLAITKRLVNLHQSDISVTSELEKGSEFAFTISFKLPQNEAEDFAGTTNNPMLNLHGMNILIVDDNKMNLLIASRFLKKWQANVDEATNGGLAVELSNNKTYDLIIMDLQMPVMSGFEATAIIKKNNPDVPVIALTADAMPETYNKALESGMSDYLTKPFIPVVFFEKVSKYYKQVI
jgi:two-component system sensor histidine kinase/response regulator